ncbi:unnamed protein product [Brassica rapa]|uniref:Uncharacterized protein n=1 Tax=Brassica campestris TaxID=3711 RepID=A0A3P6CPD6_BRACM|nr:unnamed protein product [Brassica rapa]VDD17516.1 unnamed protein product [Brassica rapa]
MEDESRTKNRGPLWRAYTPLFTQRLRGEALHIPWASGGINRLEQNLGQEQRRCVT